MLKPVVAIAAAAIIAVAFTVIAAPAADVAASPLPQPAVNAAPGCKERPWPYSTAWAPNSAIQTSV